MAAFTVKQATFQATTAAASATSTPGITTTSGSLLIALVTTFGNTIGASPMSDNFSNTWLTAVGSTGSGSGFSAMYYVPNCIGGVSHTATFTPNSADFMTITFIEVPGAALASVLSSSATSTASTSTHAAGPITANATVAEIFIGVGSVSLGTTPLLTTTNPHTWFQLEAQSGAVTEGCFVAFRIMDPLASDSFTYTSGAGAEGVIVAGFKAAASGGGGSAGGSFTFFGA